MLAANASTWHVRWRNMAKNWKCMSALHNTGKQTQVGLTTSSSTSLTYSLIASTDAMSPSWFQPCHLALSTTFQPQGLLSLQAPCTACCSREYSARRLSSLKDVPDQMSTGCQCRITSALTDAHCIAEALTLLFLVLNKLDCSFELVGVWQRTGNHSAASANEVPLDCKNALPAGDCQPV